MNSETVANMLRASRGGWGVAIEESVVDSFHIPALIGTALSDNIYSRELFMKAIYCPRNQTN